MTDTSDQLIVITFDGEYGLLGIRPKEIAVATVGPNIATWTAHIQHDNANNNLPPMARHQNDYLQKFCQCLTRDYGKIPLETALQSIKQFVHTRTRIITKGAEQAFILTHLLQVKVQNSQDLYPNLNKNITSTITCTAPVHYKLPIKFTCATNRAVRLAKQLHNFVPTK